jgi:hypothetical protein
MLRRRQPITSRCQNVTMLWSSGDGIKSQLVRINLDAIAAWWLNQAEPIKGKKDASGFWAVGVTF